MKANTNNVNKTCVLLQTTGGKDEPNFVCMRKSQRTSQHGTQTVKTHNFNLILIVLIRTSKTMQLNELLIYSLLKIFIMMFILQYMFCSYFILKTYFIVITRRRKKYNHICLRAYLNCILLPILYWYHIMIHIFH